MYDIVFLTDIFFGQRPSGAEAPRHYGYSDRAAEVDQWNFWSRYLGPYAVAQSVRDQVPEKSVKVVDYFTRISGFFEEFAQIAGPETQYICLSTTFLQNVFNERVSEFNLWHSDHDALLEWFSELKRVAPNAEIVLGGHACDVYFRAYCQNPTGKQLPEAMRRYVDHVFHGYGEDLFVEFLQGTVSPEHVFESQGLKFYSDNRKAGQGAKCLQVCWSDEEAVQPGEWLPAEISKGCRFGCRFCMFDRLGTTIKEEDVLRSELIRNYENFGTTGYLFTDDTINDTLGKVEMIHRVSQSLPFDLEWISYARPDTFYKKPHMLDMLLESGCRGMFLGLETFNPEAARIAGKGLHPDRIKGILEMIKEKGGDDVFVLGSFILGLVGETELSLEETLQYLKGQKVIDKISFEVLYVRPPDYRTNLDNDFSENSSKYGFRKITGSPYYWEHETLNYHQCCEIKNRWKNELSQAVYSGAESGIEGFTNFWAYPRLRSLGLSHQRAFDILKSREVPEEVYRKNIAWIKSYHRDLINGSNRGVVFSSDPEASRASSRI